MSDMSDATKVKLFHDDVRRPPDDSWTWVRDNATARAVLAEFEVEIIDLDHDLGGHNIDPDSPDAIYYKGNSEDDGMKLVDWMIRTGNLPRFIRVHSWNPVGAQRWYERFRRTGISACAIGLMKRQTASR